MYSDVSCDLHFVDGFQNDAALKGQELDMHIHPQQTVPRSTIARFSISISSTTPFRRIHNVERQYSNKSFVVHGISSKRAPARDCRHSRTTLLPALALVSCKFHKCVSRVVLMTEHPLTRTLSRLNLQLGKYILGSLILGTALAFFIAKQTFHTM